jgi:hypothetical protein
VPSRISEWASGKVSRHRLGGYKHRSIQRTESVSIEVDIEEEQSSWQRMLGCALAGWYVVRLRKQVLRQYV